MEDNIEKIIENYKDWKVGHDADYCVDEIYEFAATLGRSGMHTVFENLVELWKDVSYLQVEIKNLEQAFKQ